MTSVVIKGPRYRIKPEEADKFGPFNKTFLAEGDSWMDASAWNQGSMPSFLADTCTRLGQNNLIINIATSGDTLTRIADLSKSDFAWWLNQQNYDAILFSAGGNDLIDAAKAPPIGQGILVDMTGKPTPANPADCVRQEGLRSLKTYLDANFDTIYRTLRGSGKNASTPIYLNCYDTPVARDAPAVRNVSGPWLYTAYRSHGIAPSIWEALTRTIFEDLKATIQGWTVGRVGVVAVPTGGLLHSADPDSSGNSGDWVNEIHPNGSGWGKLVAAWLKALPA
jgi:lysophospholipase L1-like esterase